MFRLAGADRLAAGGKNARQRYPLQFAFIKATEGEKLVDPYFSLTGN